MDWEAGSSGSSYYTVLGIRKDASVSDIRNAYRKLALKWHPDRFASRPAVAGEAKQRFQQIQEAYSVLSDEAKRSVYDAGFFDPLEIDQGFCDFMQEMATMMNNVSSEGDSLEDLQKMFVEMVGQDSFAFDFGVDQTAKRKTRVAPPSGSAARRNATQC